MRENARLCVVFTEYGGISGGSKREAAPEVEGVNGVYYEHIKCAGKPSRGGRGMKQTDLSGRLEVYIVFNASPSFH